MPRPKKERGRPIENKLPPRIDATPEAIAEAFFRFPMGKKIDDGRGYRCSQCGEEVNYPAVLDRKGWCSNCAQALA